MSDRPSDGLRLRTGVQLRWRIAVLAEGLIFLGFLFLSTRLQPVWFGGLVLAVGLFASAGAWTLIVSRWTMRAVRARKIPK